MTRPSGVLTTVPAGTRRTRSSPRPPCRLLPSPGLPLPAFWCGRWWKSSSVCTLGVDLEDDVAAVAAVAAVGPAERLELLAVDRGHAVAAVAGSHVQDDAVDEGGHARRHLTVSEDADERTGRSARALVERCSARECFRPRPAVMETVLRPRRVPKVTEPGASANSVSSLPRPTPRPGWKWVPRWRTMISPALTTWPPKRLTPRRWALESRPLRDDEAPFLCAMSGSALRDVADHDVW